MAESDFMNDCNLVFGKYTFGSDHAVEGIFLRYKDKQKYFPTGYSCVMTIINYLGDKAKECDRKWHISFQDVHDSAETSVEKYLADSKVYGHVKKQFKDRLLANRPEDIRIEYTKLPYNTEKALREWLVPGNSNGDIFRQRIKEIRCEL